MERPERPSRHKSNPVKFPSFPSFSSDSESELNDSEIPIQITYYQSTSEAASSTGGPSTSSATAQPGSQNNAESSNNLLRVSPMPLRGKSLNTHQHSIPISTREEEVRTEPAQEPVRKKRCAASLAASAAAASVIFDSADTLASSTSTSATHDPPQRPLERFQHSDYVIRPRSFCNIDCGNAIHPPVYKLKRLSAPIDLTPSTPNRESSSQAPVVTSSFSLRDNAPLPANTETTQNNYYNNRTTATPPFVVTPRIDHQSSSSSILRQFDEMCSTSPVIRRRPRAFSVRFFDGGSRYENSHSDTVNTNPMPNRSSALDDYCELVDNFLFNYPPTSPPTNGNILRTPPLPPERAGPGTESQSSNTADMISRHINTTPSIINNDPSMFSDINTYLDPPGTARNDIGGGEPMEQNNDDVIVVETPERPPLPGTPDPDVVPSSRSPSPPHSVNPSTSSNKPDKAQPSCSGEVPMTLQELNQTLVSLLECPVCLDHATPPIYQCCKGHILCQNCHPRLTTCPICRSRLPGDRNSAMEKVAEKLMYPCKNTVTGCSMMLKLDDKQEHEEGCGFRHYACIVTSCHWKGYKPELVVHLQSSHPDRLISGTTKEVQIPITPPVSGAMFVAHHWIQSAHNEVFNVIFHVDFYKRIMKGCVMYIGSPDKADKFSYVFELKQRTHPFRQLSYSRTTYADTLKPGQPLCLSNDFNINIDMARVYRPEDTTIPLHISILPIN